MPQPQAYNRKTDFAARDSDRTDHLALNHELDDVAQTLNAVRGRQAVIQRDDGGLKNGIVGIEALSDAAYARLIDQATIEAKAEAEGAAQIATRQADLASQQALSAAGSAQAAAAAAAAAQASASNAAGSASSASGAALAAENSANDAAGYANSAAATAAAIVRVEQFHNGGADHTAAFIAACALGKHVLATGTSYSIAGEIPMASGCRLEFTANPTITMDVSGENGRGFYFGPGVENAGVFGSANINVSASSLGSDGSRNGVFCFGSDYYVTSDPAAIRRCVVMGNFKINCTGANNTKPVAIFGYVEDVLIHGVHATGQTNYAFFAHWVGNGAYGVLPTKTWHPHRLKFENCTAEDTASGALLRAFTTSACGHVVFENCHSIDANTLGFNLFVGDYGYTYAQNVNNSNAFDVNMNNCTHTGKSTALSVDGISSRLHGSPYWTGVENNAALKINGFLAQITPGANAIDVAISGLANIYATGLRIIEEADGNAQSALNLTSVRSGRLSGEIVARGGALIRDCGNVDYGMHTAKMVETHDVTSYCVGVSASSVTAVTAAAALAGATQLQLTAVTIVAGAGGIIRYNDGVRDWEMEVRSMTFSGGAQTIKISPSPVVIPAGATVTIIQTVKTLAVGAVTLSGARSLIRLTGTAVAKPRNIGCSGTQFFRSGLADIEAQQVDGLTVRNTFHDHAGQTTTTQNTQCILLGNDAESYSITNSRFGKNNQRVRYLINCANGSKNGAISGNIFESINASTTSPAAIFKSSAENVQIGANVVEAGITPVYPAV